MEKRHERNWRIAIIFMLFLCVFLCLIDLNYNGYFYCCYLWDLACQLEEILMRIGFERETALKLLSSSLGLVVTMITFALNMGVNLFNRYERKIYGIPYGELYESASRLRKMSQRIGLGLPILMVIAVNLELCGTSYMLLFYSYILVFYNYGSYGRSYDKEKIRRDVVDKIISYAKKGCTSSEQLMDYDAIVEDIRAEIWKTERWSNAWRLLDDLTERFLDFENEEAYTLACHLWESMFDNDENRKRQASLMYVKKFIGKMEHSHGKYERRLLILWSLLSSLISLWTPETLQSFLKWFVDSINSGNQKNFREKAGIVLLMLAYWFYMRDDNIEIDFECTAKIYEYGRHLFINEKKYIVDLTYLYKRQYQINDGEKWDQAQILYLDIKYGLNNSLLKTELGL